MFPGHLSSNYYCGIGKMSRHKGAFRSLHLIQASTGRRWKTRFAYPKGMVAYEDDYVKEPEYPPIDPEIRLMSDGDKERHQTRLNWCESIRKQPTVEEKNLQLNMTKRYGWFSQVVHEKNIAYGSLPYYKHITRTHMASTDSLPSSYSAPELTEKVLYFKEKVRTPLIEALKFERDIIMRNSELPEIERSLAYDDSTNSIVSQINRIMLTVLGKEVAHLNTCSTDSDPRISAFWMVGGMEPSARDRNHREHMKKLFETNKMTFPTEVDDPVERNLQFFGSPMLQVRCETPLNNFVETDSPLITKGEDITNRFNYESRVYGVKAFFKFASMMPGHWSGDNHRCCHIGVHSFRHLSQHPKRNEYWEAESENTLQSQAMLVSFGRLVSQAFFHGFDQFTDTNNPLSTQTIITDGLRWSFFAYQMNTMKLDKLNIGKNNKQNICWGTKSMNIFDKEKENSDQLNEVVLENLLKFYLNPPNPSANSDVDVSPFLKAKLTDYEDERVRAVFFFNYRDMLIQKQDRDWSYRHRQFPEVYDWEKIYKIRFNMRPMDARRKHYELPFGFPGADPYNEPYVLKDPTFVGKGLRNLRALNDAAKEKDRIEAAKLHEKSKFAQVEEE